MLVILFIVLAFLNHKHFDALLEVCLMDHALFHLDSPHDQRTEDRDKHPKDQTCPIYQDSENLKVAYQKSCQPRKNQANQEWVHRDAVILLLDTGKILCLALKVNGLGNYDHNHKDSEHDKRCVRGWFAEKHVIENVGRFIKHHSTHNCERAFEETGEKGCKEKWELKVVLWWWEQFALNSIHTIEEKLWNYNLLRERWAISQYTKCKSKTWSIHIKSLEFFHNPLNIDRQLFLWIHMEVWFQKVGNIDNHKEYHHKKS